MWTLANRLERADSAVWLARFAALPLLGTLGGFLVWWGAYLLGNRATLDVHELENLAAWLLILGVASCLLSQPLAKRAISLLRNPDEERQRRQALAGTATHLAIGTAVVLSFTNATNLTNEIHTARIANDGVNNAATSYPPVRDPYAPVFKTPEEIAEEKKHEIPWNGKGIDPNFPVH